MSNYKPTEHDGLREDGKPDGRVGTGEFAYGKVDPSEAGHQGGQVSDSGNRGNTSSGDKYKPSEHDGLREDGNPDGRVGTGEFAYGKVNPSEAGRQGGLASDSGNGGSTSGGDKYKPSEHGGLREDGQPDGRMKNN